MPDDTKLLTTGALTTGFDATSTAAEVLAGVDLHGRRAVVTGGASGIGIETARALAAAGAEVTLAVRRVGPAEAVADALRASTGNDAIHIASLELVDPASISAFAAAWSGPLHILVNNAGVMAIGELTRSAAGDEMQFATNHLGHFALTTALHPALAAGGARIVSVSSSGHLRSPVVFDDLDYRFRDYDPFGAYGQSKTANVLLAVHAASLWAEDGITANALMPGGIFTELQRHVGGSDYIEQAKVRFADAGVRFKTPEQGAATSVLLAASPLLDGVTGRYFEDCNEASLVDERLPVTLGGVAAYALDTDNAERLWATSLALTGA